MKNYGLRNLTALLLKFRISKSSRTTNWSVDNLSIKQMEYAAEKVISDFKQMILKTFE